LPASWADADPQTAIAAAQINAASDVFRAFILTSLVLFCAIIALMCFYRSELAFVGVLLSISPATQRTAKRRT
jgi:hypothetical protein